MSDDKNITNEDLPPPALPAVPPAAQRALAEATARRAKQDAHEAELEAKRSKEQGGPRHIEPTRYGDWERKGITYDF